MKRKNPFTGIKIIAENKPPLIPKYIDVKIKGIRANKEVLSPAYGRNKKNRNAYMIYEMKI